MGNLNSTNKPYGQFRLKALRVAQLMASNLCPVCKSLILVRTSWTGDGISHTPRIHNQPSSKWKCPVQASKSQMGNLGFTFIPVATNGEQATEAVSAGLSVTAARTNFIWDGQEKGKRLGAE